MNNSVVRCRKKGNRLRKKENEVNGLRPESLLDTGLQVGHISDGLMVHPPLESVEDIVHLPDQGVQHLGVLGQLVHHRPQRLRSCLVPSKQEDDALKAWTEYL
jgi:hypothetical protein